MISIVVQTLIRKLKTVEHTTPSKEQLLLYDGKVINTIIAGGFGSVSVTTLDGIISTYPAKAEADAAYEIQKNIIFKEVLI